MKSDAGLLPAEPGWPRWRHAVAPTLRPLADYCSSTVCPQAPSQGTPFQSMRHRRRLAILACLAAGCREAPPEQLVPALVISPSADSAIGSFNQAALRDCRIAVYDHGSRAVHLFDGPVKRATIGRRGNGPGEIGHLFALSVAEDGSVAAIDWGRRRRLWWAADGTLRRDDPLLHAPAGHAMVGPIIARADGSYLDLPFGGHVGGTAIGLGELAASPLLYGVGPSGTVLAKWGTLDQPRDTSALMLRGLLQAGDLTVANESVYVLRAVEPRIEVFALAAGSPSPVRSLRLGRWRPESSPTERAGRVGRRGYISGSRVELHEAATVFARDAAGRFYVVMLGPLRSGSDLKKGEGPWPEEQIWVFSAEGSLLRRFSHQARNTRMLAIASDGALIALAHPNGDEDESWSLIIYRAMDGAAGQGKSCGWAAQESP
jgi:hypothetical protein